MELWLRNFNFAPIWSCGDLEIRPLDLKFSEILNTAPISLAGGQKCPPLAIFGHEITFILDFGHQIFRNASHYLNKVFFIDKSAHLIHLNGVMAPKVNFWPYLVMQ